MADKINNRVVILQNVTLKTNSINFSQEKTNFNRDDLICDDNDKENDPVMYKTKCRRTASSYIFDEEPIFSDSDEEKEYCKNILEFQKCFVKKYKTSKMLEEAQCSLSVDDLKIINIIKECADVSVENVKDDFKQLVKICKDMHVKYKHVEPIQVKIITTHNGVPNKEAFSKTNLSNNDWVVLPEERVCREKFAPSRRGNSSEGNDFFSQTFSFDSGFSCEIQEPIHRHTSGICITNKKKKSLHSAQSRVKKETVSISKNNSGEIKNVLKQTKIVKTVTNVQKGRNEKQNTKLKRANIKNSRHDLFYQKARPLPREKLRLLARTWMKPDKSILNKLPGDGKSAQLKSKSRKLFSANKWQHSPEFLSQYIE